MSLTTYKNHSSLGLGSRLADYGKVNPNQLGLGLKIFGKKITVGGVVGGLVNRLVSWGAAAVETSVPLVGKGLADEIRDFGKELAASLEFKIDGWLNAPYTLKPEYSTTNSGELTANEEKIIMEWYPKFEAFVANLIKEAGAALKLTDRNAMLTGVNAVLNKINAVQDHYTVSQQLGLSQNAIDQRNYLIYEGLKIVHFSITEGVAALKDTSNLISVQVTFPMNQYDFRPLFSSSIVTTVTGENYKIATGGSTKNPSLPTKNPSLPSKGGLQPGVITFPGDKGSIIPAMPVNTGSTPVPTKVGVNDTVTDSQTTGNESDSGTGNGTTTGGTTNVSGKSNTTNKVVIGGLGLLAIVLAAKALTKKKPARRKQPGKKK